MTDLPFSLQGAFSVRSLTLTHHQISPFQGHWIHQEGPLQQPVMKSKQVKSMRVEDKRFIDRL
jgi:hypothetical protein